VLWISIYRFGVHLTENISSCSCFVTNPQKTWLLAVACYKPTENMASCSCLLQTHRKHSFLQLLVTNPQKTWLLAVACYKPTENMASCSCLLQTHRKHLFLQLLVTNPQKTWLLAVASLPSNMPQLSVYMSQHYVHALLKCDIMYRYKHSGGIC
jgi:multisubunit Na+/H+ antiporter MnhG subunit